MGNKGDKKPCERMQYVPTLSHQKTQSPAKAVGSVNASTVQSTSARPQSNQSGAIAEQSIPCFHCNKLGHKSFDCPQKNSTTVNNNGVQTSPHTAFAKDVRVPREKHVIPVYINGESKAHAAYRDTGASLSLCAS